MANKIDNKKRKSVDGNTVATVKKVKVAKSADRPAPGKSALKKSSSTEVAEESQEHNGKPVTRSTKTKISTKPDSNGAVQKVVEVSPNNGSKKSKSKALSKVEKDVTAELDNEDGAEAGAELTEDQTAALLAGFSSSDEESDGETEEGLALDKIPAAPTTDDIQNKIKKAVQESSNDPDAAPGVIYVGRIPHGFYEPQMRAYFSQFGEIHNLRLARNRKTGKPQHFAFIEFSSAAVAEIVAKTMDKYLMFGHILQVRVVPREHVKESTFRGANKRLKVMPRNKIERGLLKRGMVREGWEKRVENENKRRAEKAQKLKELGYEFEMPEVKAVDAVPVKSTDVEEVSAVIEDGNADAEPAVELAEEVHVEPGSVEVTATAGKKRSSAEGVKKVKKAKKAKTTA